jgi:hypothetical protein
MTTEQFTQKAEIPSDTRRGQPSADSNMRLKAAYWPYFPWQIPTQENAIPKRQCKVCSAKKLKSMRWECERHKVVLLMTKCFKIYHIQQNFYVRFLF